MNFRPSQNKYHHYQHRSQKMNYYLSNILPELNILLSEKLIKKGSHKTLPLNIYNYTSNTSFRNKWTPLSILCRGLVVDRNTGRIISKPMTKFFNRNEKQPKFLAPLPNMNAFLHEPFTISEKMDGSLGIWFWYDRAGEDGSGDWMMVTRGSFYSKEARIAEVMAREKGLDLEGRCQKGLTYCFEIIHPDCKILVDYRGRKELVLLAVIESKIGYDTPTNELPAIAEVLGVQAAPFWMSDEVGATKLSDWQNRDILGKEGYVIRFESGRGPRTKLKFSNYVARHKTLSAFSKTIILEWLIRNPGKGIVDEMNDVPDEFFEEAKEVERRWGVVKKEGVGILMDWGGDVERNGGLSWGIWKKVEVDQKWQNSVAGWVRVYGGKTGIRESLERKEEEFGILWAEDVLRREFKDM